MTAEVEETIVKILKDELSNDYRTFRAVWCRSKAFFTSAFVWTSADSMIRTVV